MKDDRKTVSFDVRLTKQDIKRIAALLSEVENDFEIESEAKLLATVKIGKRKQVAAA